MKHLIIKNKSKKFEILIDTYCYIKGDIDNWHYLHARIGPGVRINQINGDRIEIPFNQYLFEIRENE